MKQERDERSDVVRLLDLIWNGCNSATDHSWERLNHAMSGALRLAIDAGLEFAEGDIRHICHNYSSGRWLGACREWIYRSAIAVGNDSAVASFEKYMHREPIIADNVYCSNHYSQGTHGNSLIRQRCRLFVGAEFQWQGQRVTVTSFADDQTYANACSYKPREAGSYASKIAKRFKITRADIIADRAARKSAAKEASDVSAG